MSKLTVDVIAKERLDFGFDSIYFRYALIRDALAEERAKYTKDYTTERRKVETDKQHFWFALEELTHAHEQQNEF